MKFLIIVAILVGILPQPRSTLAQSAVSTTPAFVQSQDARIASGDTLSVTLPMPITTGSVIVAYVVWTNGDTATLSDSQNNVYQSAVGPTPWQDGEANAQVWYANPIAGGSNTVTATFASPVTTFGVLQVHEYAGLDQTNPIDAATAATGTSDTPNSGSVITSNANDLLFGAGASNDAFTALAGPYVPRSRTAGNLTADALVDTAGTYDVRANQTGSQWVMQLVALRGTGGAAPASTPTATSTATAAPTATSAPAPTQTPVPAAVVFPPAPTPVQATYPLKLSANHRYLVGQNNAPFLMVGDSPQAMIGDLSEGDADFFLANRQAAGYNAQWINLLCNKYTACNADGTTYDGVQPFKNMDDLSSPNESYFSKVDSILHLAANHNQVVLLDPIETGGWTTIATNNGASKAYNYGKYLGLRYRNYPNIIWMSGNDFQTWRTGGDDAAIRAVAEGIKDNDPNHIQTSELDYRRSASLDDSSWIPLLGLDAAYTYYPTYDLVLKEYNRANIPVFMVEANYEGEHNAGDQGTPSILRRQDYWTLLSGATGQLFGNHYTWQFANGWKSNLDTPASVQMKYVTALFAPRPWYDLVPDQNHSVVTAGYGTYDANSSIGANDYLTAARTGDGTVVLAYMPTLRTITVDLSKLAGPGTARWYDPSRGTYSPAIAGSPFANSGSMQFTPPGNNADGDGDWVLVLETAPVGASQPGTAPVAAALPDATAAPPSPSVAAAAPTTGGATFVQVSSAVPQSPQASVSVSYTQGQSAGDTNILAIGWNDSSSNITSVSDSAGNTYQVAAPVTRGTGLSQAIYYAKNINASGSNTVTIGFSGPVPFADVRIMEYSGLDKANPFDTSASGSGSASVASSGNATTTAANELIVGAGMTNGAFGGVDSQFATRVVTSPDGDLVEDRTVSAAGSYAATAPVNDVWVMQLAAFH